MVTEQHFDGRTYSVSAVLAELRQACRAMTGIPLAKEDEPLESLELNAIFLLCYAAYNGYGTRHEVRTDRWMRDVKDYRAGNGVPYYVMHTAKQFRTNNIEEIVHLRVLWEHYVALCQTQRVPVPELTFAAQPVAPSS